MVPLWMPQKIWLLLHQMLLKTTWSPANSSKFGCLASYITALTATRACWPCSTTCCISTWKPIYWLISSKLDRCINDLASTSRIKLFWNRTWSSSWRWSLFIWSQLSDKWPQWQVNWSSAQTLKFLSFKNSMRCLPGQWADSQAPSVQTLGIVSWRCN